VISVEAGLGAGGRPQPGRRGCPDRRGADARPWAEAA